MAIFEAPVEVGLVGALWRYPVKSMLGERVETAPLTQRGMLGDREYALVDPRTASLGSAKNPRKWGYLLGCKARLTDAPGPDCTMPPALITLPDGATGLTSDEAIRLRLSADLGHEVVLARRGAPLTNIDKYWPDIDGLEHRGETTREDVVPGSFFDGDPVHLLTTASLGALAALYPASYFDVRRFRPNIVIYTPPGQRGFVEKEWIGRVLAIGDSVRLRVKRQTRRCVITTLAQGELPRDLGVLRAAAQHNDASVGVYAEIIREGVVAENEPVRLLD